MKKHVLDTNAEEDYLLMGILSSEKPSRLVWLLNQTLACNFERAEDIETPESPNESFCKFEFNDPENHMSLFLFGNKANGQVLIRESGMNQMDYFIHASGALDFFDAAVFLKTLQALPAVRMAAAIDPSRMKSKLNLYL